MYNRMRSQAHDPVKEPVEDGTEDEDDEDKRTIFCANIDQRVTEEILFEVFLQAGPIESVKIPKDGGRQKSFGFITYVHQCSVPFALKLLSGLSLYKKLLTIKPRQTKAFPSDVEPLLRRPGNSGASEFIPMRGGTNISPYNEVNPFKTDITPPKGLGWSGQRRGDDLKKHSSHNTRPHQNTPYSRVDNSRDHGGGGASGAHRNRHSGRRSRNR